MRTMSVIMYSALAAVAAAAVTCGTGSASATTMDCTGGQNRDITRVNGNTACRATDDGRGHARAAGIDGVGYAKSTRGGFAISLGAKGGVGASEGTSALPIAIGLGRDAVALTSIDSASRPGRVGVTVAMNGSQAQVVSTRHSTICLGAAALAWDSGTGAACAGTPFGQWSTPAARQSVPER